MTLPGSLRVEIRPTWRRTTSSWRIALLGAALLKRLKSSSVKKYLPGEGGLRGNCQKCICRKNVSCVDCGSMVKAGVSSGYFSV